MLVMEYCDEGDLYSYLSKNGFKLSEQEAIYIIRQILYGINYLHQYNITHRDLKPQNILISISDNKRLYKVADFGLSRFFLPKEKSNEPYGTLVSLLIIMIYLVLLCTGAGRS